jgi:EAL domain-containing protein (putative c-di-GMP-specific phosphodiesterase class I)
MTPLEAIVSTQDTSLEGVESATARTAAGVVGQFRNLTLHSHFHPIISLAHRRIIGYEGLLRPRGSDGHPRAPNVLFDTVKSNDDIVFLDRLARNTHVRNFLAAGQTDAWLFLNVNARVATHGRAYPPFFKAMLERHGLAPHRVVIELVENEVPDEALLADAMRYYQDLGCLVAIDDFGAGYSNFERIWRVQPQIVKLDRTMLVQARESRRVRRVLPSLVALLHETGCLTLIEGIENEEEVMIAMDAGVDFVQGFFFSRPEPALRDQNSFVPLLGGLCGRYSQTCHENRERNRSGLSVYIEAFRDFAGLSEDAQNAWEALSRMLALSDVLRCYVLDANGYQMGENIVAPGNESKGDLRFQPISNPAGAVWARRPYFQRAVAEPGQVQVSRPYLSITDARICITLSVKLKNALAQDVVVCADILWDDT